jgi:hypothetical protein
MVSNAPTLSDKFDAVSQDPKFRLTAYLNTFLDTENPVYCWEAIKLCSDHNLPFPDWVCMYLGTVANVMLSDEVRQCSDLRKVLPHVLGFPKRTSGPGRLLDPNPRDPKLEDRADFALKFISKLEQNHECEPTEAFEEAQREMDTSVADMDDKTLWRWLTEELHLTRKPKTNAEWRAAGRALHIPFVDLIEKAHRDLARRQTENKGANQPGAAENLARKDR